MKLNVRIIKLLNPLFNFFRRDAFSLAPIFSRQDLIQVGTKYGGWVVPKNLIDSNSICYCVGCGEDISFDLGLIEKFNCSVFAFDPTPKAIKYVNAVAGFNDKYNFFEVGLWDESDILKFYAPKNPDHVSHSIVNLQNTKEFISIKVNRLSKVMEENNHKKIDLLKIDIEGAEYKVIDSILDDDLDVRIICVEYDEFFNPLDSLYRVRIKKSIDSLINKNYVLVYSQGNGNYTFVKSS